MVVFYQNKFVGQSSLSAAELYILSLSRAFTLVMLIVRPLADWNLLLSGFYRNVYRSARPEAYQIVDTSEDARASSDDLYFVLMDCYCL